MALKSSGNGQIGHMAGAYEILYSGEPVTYFRPIRTPVVMARQERGGQVQCPGWNLQHPLPQLLLWVRVLRRGRGL